MMARPAVSPGGTTPPSPLARGDQSPRFPPDLPGRKPAVSPGGTTPQNPPGRKPAILAIDGGNSKTDVALVAEDGTLLVSVRGPGASQEAYGIDGAMRILDGLVRTVASKAGADADEFVARHTSACLAGADLPEEEAALTAALLEQGWTESATALNDTFAVLRAGLRPDRGEPAWGAAVTCGAGINCVAVAPDGRAFRYLSFGSLSGDLGGGGWLSEQVLWHAVRAEDGRGPATTLAALAAERFGLASATEVTIAVHKGRLAREDLLPLTSVLLSAADAGDPVARSVVERQADEICALAVNALRQLGILPPASGEGPAASADEPPTASGKRPSAATLVEGSAASPDCVPVVLGGGVLESRNPLLLSRIAEKLAVAAPRALPRVVDIPPVAGAALLGLDHVGASPSAEHRLREGYP
jgi:N-acetylglucosamine kinase-like BadF-type ATPase